MGAAVQRPVEIHKGCSVLTRIDGRGLRGFALKRVLIADQPYRDATAERLLRDRAKGMADLLDLLTLNPGARRQAVRALGELEAHRD